MRQGAKNNTLKNGMGVILLKGLISINSFIKHHVLVHIKKNMHAKISVSHTDLLLFFKLIDVSLCSLHFCHSCLSAFASLMCVQASLQWFAGDAG